ncbi:MAG: cupin-like domain-containing protein [Microcoleaceae cyanobacterium]
MTDPQSLKITLPPLQITLQDQNQVSLQWLAAGQGVAGQGNALQVLDQNPSTESAQAPSTSGTSVSNPQAPSPEIPDTWKQWAATNILMGRPETDLIRIMVEHDLDHALVQQEVTSLKANPYCKAAEQFIQQLQKLESLSEIQHQLQQLSTIATQVERKIGLSRTDFLNHYYGRNTPVIFTGIMNNWSALKQWNPDYFQKHYGDVTVEVQANRNSDPKYEINVDRHRKKVKFRDYISWIKQGNSGNDYYIVANNGNLDREELKGLLQDIEIFPEYLDSQQTKGRIFFWFGPAGTVTPLHHDPVNLMLAQVRGRKRILLVPPQQTPYLYNHLGVFSEVDVTQPDYQKYPLFRNVKPIEVILEPGEVIFIPVGWWHHVTSLDVSISVSFTNFVFPNHYTWKNPSFGQR